MQRLKIFRFVALIVLCSCSRVDPELAHVSMRLVYTREQDAVKERFSFFVIASDEDGIENLSDLYLYHDLEGLRWTLTEDDWVTLSQNNTTWIGSRSIAMADDAPLPRGLYRAVLVNKGGGQVSRSVSFDPPLQPRFPFPSFSVADGTYTASSQYPNNYLIGYNAQGDYTQTVQLTSLRGALADVRFNDATTSAALWAEDPLYATSALTDAQSIK